jgi:hypothetical protein
MEFDKHSLDFSSQQDCSDICRLCLGHSKLQPLSISKFAADFDNYNFVEIPLGFNLPENMCLECIGELDRIALFIEKCKNSHVVLKQIEKKCDTVCNSDVKIEFFDDSNEELKYCSDSITEVKNIENVASSSSLNYALKESGLKKEVDQFEQSEEYSLDREIKSEYTRMVSSDSSDESDSIDNLASLSTHTASNSQDADIVEKCDNCGVTDTKMANRYQMSKCCCPKDYKCPTCNLTFKNKSGLTNHQADCRLSDVSPTHFMCPEKGKQFISEVCGKELKIPEKSKRQYEKCYSDFRDWCNKKNVETVSENVVLTYLLEKSKILKSASLWSTYSMLKLMLNIRDGIDVTKFLKLVPFLKKKSVGYQAKKSQVLTREQINLFLEKASDENYLLRKVNIKFCYDKLYNLPFSWEYQEPCEETN